MNDAQGSTTWHRVVVFGQTAEELEAARTAGQIKKGRPVEVTGAQVTRKEETTTGRSRSVTEFLRLQSRAQRRPELDPHNRSHLMCEHHRAQRAGSGSEQMINERAGTR